MNNSSNLKICDKCKRPMILISFWEGEKKVHEYWICGCDKQAK